MMHRLVQCWLYNFGLALLATALLPAVLPSAAAPQPIRIANWAGGPSFKGPTKQFDKCSASATNASGIAITYTMDDRMRWHMALSSPDWSFTNDFSLSIDLRVDGRPFRGRGIVRDRSSLEIEVEDRIALFSTLRMAAQMRAIAGGLASEFDVSSSSEVFAAVAQCAVLHSKTPEANALKPGRSGSLRGTTTQDVVAVKEITELAGAMKETANIAGFRVAGPVNAPPGSVAAVGWMAERASGAIMALPAGSAYGMSGVIARLVQFEQRRCHGEYFFIASAQENQEAVSARVYVACKMPDSTSITFYIVAPRAGGGAYVLSAVSGQGFALVLHREVETIDARLRSGIRGALRRVGHASAAEGDMRGAGPNGQGEQ